MALGEAELGKLEVEMVGLEVKMVGQEVWMEWLGMEMEKANQIQSCRRRLISEGDGRGGVGEAGGGDGRAGGEDGRAGDGDGEGQSDSKLLSSQFVYVGNGGRSGALGEGGSSQFVDVEEDERCNVDGGLGDGGGDGVQEA